MKFSLSGTASNGMPVSRLVDLPDEAAVQAYAQENGITVKSIRCAANQNQGVPDSPEYRLRSTASTCFTWGWFLLGGGVLSLCIIPALALILFSVSFLLFIIGAIYGAGEIVAEAVKQKKAE
ncbi:hypothetical protein [Bremerella cremea]|uniref:hypothetical protein n=1 Tax=Bremerella cremea TaxID=1031537 RepID=UPI0011C05B01|nr:hypothetical protein [Bremerella cremea]